MPPETLADQAYDRIRRMIIETELAPGYRFTEATLADRLGFGKTPVREALGLLVQSGLVESLPRVGYRVTPITLRDVMKLFEFRTIIEPASARLAAENLTEEQADALQLTVETELPEPHSSEYLDAVTEINHRLHLGIARASGNPYLARAVEENLEHGERVYRLVMAEMVPSGDHQALVEAITNRDPESAHDIATKHVSTVRNMILNSYINSEPLMDAELVLPHRNPELG